MPNIPTSPDIFGSMLEAFNEEPDAPLDAKLAMVWDRTWPFNYNAALLDIAARAQLPLLLGLLKDLPEVKPHHINPRTIYRTPSDAQMKELQAKVASAATVWVDESILHLILREALRIGMIKLPRNT